MKLTQQQIDSIKRAYQQQNGRRGIIKSLADKYGVSRPTIYKALETYRTVKKGTSGTPVPESHKRGTNSLFTESELYTSRPSKVPCPADCGTEWCGMVCVTCGTTLWAEYGPPLFVVEVQSTYACGACDQIYYDSSKRQLADAC